jgi:hypothetical protein
MDVVLTVGVPHDHGDRVGLDNEVASQPASFFGGRLSCGLVWVSDRNQISHGVCFSFVLVRAALISSSRQPAAPHPPGVIHGLAKFRLGRAGPSALDTGRNQG